MSSQRMPRRIFGTTLLLALLAGGAAATEPTVTQNELKAAVTKSLPLLLKAAVGHREERKQCFACHQQGVPLFALTAAKAKGFAIDEAELATQLEFIAGFLKKNREQYLQGKGQGGQADTAGYALVTLAAGNWKPDDTTEAVTEYLLLRHKDQDHWGNTSNRPPTEASRFTTSYVALRGLSAFATSEQEERTAARKSKVREWLLKTTPRDTEDRVFRLLALQEVDAPQADLEAAAKELLSKQRDDGGWSQLDSDDSEKSDEPDEGGPDAARASDAYATGTALVALHKARGLATSDTAYQRGVRLPARDANGRRLLARDEPQQALPDLLRIGLPSRRGPVHLVRRQRLGHVGTGAGV